MPPADSPHLHPLPYSLQRPNASIAEEEDGFRKIDEDDGSPTNETDTTVQDETTETIEMVTPTDDASEAADKPQGEDAIVDSMTATESLEKSEEAEIRTESPDSPELD